MGVSSLSGTSWALIAVSAGIVAAAAGCWLLARRLASERAERRATQRVLDLFSDVARDYGFWLLGPEGRIRRWSRGAERIHGYDSDQVLGRHCSNLYSEPDRSANVPQRVLELAARQGRHEFRGERVRHDGRTVAVDSVLQALRDTSGNLTGFCEVEHDVSGQRQVEQTLRQTRSSLMQAHKLEAIGRLSGGVAHDFNNVIQVIKNCVRVLQRRLADQPQQLQFLDMIERNADRAAGLSQHLLGFARSEPQESGVTNVHEVIEAALQLLHQTLNENIVLEQQLRSSFPWTSIDRTQLEAALLNLAANARDAMQGGGTLAIETSDVGVDSGSGSAEGAGQYITIALSDSGARTPGTQPAMRPDASLQQVRQLIEEAGGRLSLESRPESGGTVVTLWLPCVRVPSAAASPRVADSDPDRTEAGSTPLHVT